MRFIAGNVNASVGILIALDHEIMAQAGQGIDVQSAEVLQGDVQNLLLYVANPD